MPPVDLSTSAFIVADSPLRLSNSLSGTSAAALEMTIPTVK